MNNLRFSGHETFVCKHLWPKKGFDFLNGGNKFSDPDAVVKLGVGKNMVLSIRFWMKALGLVDQNENLNILAKLIFADNGFDPYVEDIGTIWLLHYNLITTEYASVYNLVYNSYIKGKTEYTKSGLQNYIKRISIGHNGNSYNEKTVSNDINVFIRSYLKPDKGSGNKNVEDDFSSLLIDLDLTSKLNRNNSEGKSEEYFIMERKERNSLPGDIFLYAILNNDQLGNTISFNELVSGENSVGNVFLLSRDGIFKKIEEICEKYKFITYTRSGGLPLLQFEDKPDPLEIIKGYYAN
jgi:hypothetical protein